MNSKVRVFVLAVIVVTACLPSLAPALEKTAAPMADRFDGWRAGGASATCLVDYYNLCNGWVWIWSGFLPTERIGVCFSSCCTSPLGAEVDSSFVFFWSGAPAGYGWTGSIGIFNVDQDCCPIGTPLASQPLLPASGWNGIGFGSVIVPRSFAVLFTFGATASAPITIATDHPAAGPTGGVACGPCYPSTRASRSFYWGPTGSPICPGSSFNDGVCDAQFLWDASMHCFTSVEASSWATIKGLYR